MGSWQTGGFSKEGLGQGGFVTNSATLSSFGYYIFDITGIYLEKFLKIIICHPSESLCVCKHSK